MYKKGPVKDPAPKTKQTELGRYEISGPPSFYPHARDVSTADNYYSAANDQMTSDMEYKSAIGGTENHTKPSLNTGTKYPSLFW